MPTLINGSTQILLGGLLALAVALIGWRLGWLNLGGAVAAFILGGIVFGLGGISWSVVLLAFFISSSVLSKAFKAKKIESEKYYAKGPRRDAGQVLANGGLAGIFVLMHLIWPGENLLWLGFVAAFSAANADTWATELGVLSNRPPVLITNGKIVAAGTSGGITLAGTLASTFGSALVVFCAWIVWPAGIAAASGWTLLVLTVAGLLGSLADSYLGATVERMNYCPVCKKETEKYPLHNCGTATEYLRGWNWMNNDWVNFFCTLSSTLAVVLIYSGTYLH